ncbi:hypothetical protein EVAR_4984_1 [Eumeta japonica]|uniref:Uncharacterized protein n=1 Tax=Eumeta variegata TaxID=151549 RepID=A0A4C1V0G3_EUMVA|nr:hypothetical protein EVAR_4984_1 [Eumeta japonica]
MLTTFSQIHAYSFVGSGLFAVALGGARAALSALSCIGPNSTELNALLHDFLIRSVYRVRRAAIHMHGTMNILLWASLSPRVRPRRLQAPAARRPPPARRRRRRRLPNALFISTHPYFVRVKVKVSPSSGPRWRECDRREYARPTAPSYLQTALRLAHDARHHLSRIADDCQRIRDPSAIFQWQRPNNRCQFPFGRTRSNVQLTSG